MRRVLTGIMAAMLCWAIGAFAQYSSDAPSAKQESRAEKKEAKAAAKGKSVKLTGWVKSEGGKTVFVNDKDKETWTVDNPDALNGHDGHHVKVTAKLNEADKSVHVLGVKMMSKRKQGGESKDKDKM
jgi:hypothetical protein